MKPYFEETVVDAFDLTMEDSGQSFVTGDAPVSTDDMLMESLNRFGGVDLPFIAAGAAMTCEEAALELEGAIFQDPDALEDERDYDISVGWQLSAHYLSGNAAKKLEKALKANRRFPGRFARNIKALRRILPKKLGIEDIYISIGAVWIPQWEYVSFLCEFLHLRVAPKLDYNKALSCYKITPPPEASRSVLNTITYGVRSDEDRYGNAWRKQYLTAMDLVEAMLNAKTVKVFDYHPLGSGGNYRYEPVFNRNKTVEAQEKKRSIQEAFQKWVLDDPQRADRFAGYYNDAFVGYAFPRFDGSFMRFPGLNPEIRLYPHQKAAVVRALVCPKVLFAHDVGTGKTYEMIASVHELYRLKISRKNMVVCPNHLLSAMVNAHRLLYPSDRLMVVSPQKFKPSQRRRVLEEIRDGDVTAVYMAATCFDMVVMSRNYYVDQMEKEIRALRGATFVASEQEKKMMERRADSLSKKLVTYLAEAKACPWLHYDELGIETLVVDEAHNYKNIPIQSRSDHVIGLSGKGSQKSAEMLEKVHSTPRVIFATGTPLTNSLADLYTLQTYLQPEVLRYHGIHTFDAWVNTFGKRENSVECDVDANSNALRSVTRFTSFHNLSELMSMFCQVCDFHRGQEKEEGVPLYDGPVNVTVPRSEAQERYINYLSRRTDAIRSCQVDRVEDNLLKVTIDGRKAALDIRLVDENARNLSHINKVEACARRVLAEYEAHPGCAQVVFSDIGTPKASFNVYDALAHRLVSGGIPRHEIAFVHDAETESARNRLFEEVNEGKIRVIVGSTQKLGVGVNVQKRLVALHHLSVPWRPSDMVQREGRILRKGNECEKVSIYRYITEGTFDAYSWQLLETKQKFIVSLLQGLSSARESEDIADSVLDYATVKAIAIGNPLIKVRVELSIRLERAKISSKERQNQLQDLTTLLEVYPEKRRKLEEKRRIALLDAAYYDQNKETLSREELVAFGEELLYALGQNCGKEKERQFEAFRGFDIVLPAGMRAEEPFVYLRSPNGGSYYCPVPDGKTPLGCTRTVSYRLENLASFGEELKGTILEYEKREKEVLQDLEEGNPYPAEICALEEELMEIDAKLEQAAKEKIA
ncbi:MAG: hypothetical protein IKJ74_06270 [Clostridia bacterium]|nr:hypothetical protein [Clostridia bacterium]